MTFGESIEETLENCLEILVFTQRKNIENRLIYMQSFSETLITHWMVKVAPRWLTLDLGLYINKKHGEYNLHAIVSGRGLKVSL